MEQFISLEFVANLVEKVKSYIQTLDAYLSEANHLKMISMILMLLALVLFLFLILIIYIRSIVYFIKSNNPAKNMSYNEERQIFEDDESVSFDDDEQQELERELQKELDIAIAIQQAQENDAQKHHQEEETKKKREKEKIVDEEKREAVSYARPEKNNIDFDWQKGKIPPAETENFSSVTNISLSYKQSKRELNQLIGLLVDMLGRGVDELKIAQTLNFKSQGLNEENDILKTIDAVKQFINLCVSGKFIKLERYNDLPKEERALYHLTQGDSSLALALLENLMDEEIDKANLSASEEKRQKKYTEVSNYACCFGALAELNDVMLATTAYELAIELQSVNVTAWSRLGDVYKRANSDSRAVWAYQKVINLADSEIDAALLANANKHLSENLYAEGNSLQAAKLYNWAKQYYDSLGINRRLDKQEIDIIEIIENGYQQAMPETIEKLLSKNQNTRN